MDQQNYSGNRDDDTPIVVSPEAVKHLEDGREEGALVSATNVVSHNVTLTPIQPPPPDLVAMDITITPLLLQPKLPLERSHRLSAPTWREGCDGAWPLHLRL
jgi:hypothetical protein